jgi:hypothetical protein
VHPCGCSALVQCSLPIDAKNLAAPANGWAENSPSRAELMAR